MDRLTLIEPAKFLFGLFKDDEGFITEALEGATLESLHEIATAIEAEDPTGAIYVALVFEYRARRQSNIVSEAQTQAFGFFLESSEGRKAFEEVESTLTDSE